MIPDSHASPSPAPVLAPQEEGRQAQRRQADEERAQQAVCLGLLRGRAAAGRCRHDVRRGGHHGGQLQRVASRDQVPARLDEGQPLEKAEAVFVCCTMLRMPLGARTWPWRAAGAPC